MSFTGASTAAAVERRDDGPFSGLDVATTAGLQLAPGSTRPMFDHDVWDLSGLVGAPVIMGAHRKVLDFTQIANPRWRTVARQYLLARMAPGHPAVATLPHALRGPLNPNSLWTALKHLGLWFNYLTEAGVMSLTDLTQAHCDGYLAHISRRAGVTERSLSPATLTVSIRATQMLALYTEVLDERYRPGFTPWAGRSPDVIAGYVRPYGNRTPPVPDALLRPLLANTLYLVTTIAPHLAAEAAAARAFDHRQAQSQRHLATREMDRVRAAISRSRPTLASRRRGCRRAASRSDWPAAGTQTIRCCTWHGTRSSSTPSPRWATGATWSGYGRNSNTGWRTAGSTNPGHATPLRSPAKTPASRFPGRRR